MFGYTVHIIYTTTIFVYNIYIYHVDQISMMLEKIYNLLEKLYTNLK